MSEFDCVSTTQYSGGYISGVCIVCPAMPEIIAVPDQTIIDNRPGWNASAISTQQHSNNLYTEFTVLPSIGTAVGLSPIRFNDDPRSLLHAIYCYREEGLERWVVYESGVAKTAPIARAPTTDLFRIERRGTQMTYFFNNQRYYVSTLPSTGPLIVVATMYLAGDGVE